MPGPAGRSDRLSRRRWIGCLLGLAVTILVFSPFRVQADTFTVTRTDDPVPDGCRTNDCSLREAVIAANASPGSTIVLQALTYNLSRIGAGEDLGWQGDLDVLQDLTISGSYATINANGVDRVFHVLNDAYLTLIGVTMTGGSAAGANGGGIYVENGWANLTECTLANNTAASGGGLNNKGRITLSGCTLYSNHATLGGGIYNQGPRADLTNCTISSNTASNLGGGLYNFGAAAYLDFTTIALNSALTGGGIYIYSGAVEVWHTLIAGNIGSSPDCAGGLVSAGYNLIGNSNGAGFGFLASDILDPPYSSNHIVGPLAGYGGPTLTHALVEGSPAIDAGDPYFAGPPYYDQRGWGYSRILGWAVDIGAYEYDPGEDGGEGGIISLGGAAARGGCGVSTSSK
ncbi:MAG: CSLREA domain-containing protein [Thermodesulfobacteriota bacterium]